MIKNGARGQGDMPKKMEIVSLLASNIVINLRLNTLAFHTPYHVVTTQLHVVPHMEMNLTQVTVP